MHTRNRITHVLGALALFGTVSAQSAMVGYDDPVLFEAALAKLGLENRTEGFEPLVGKTKTPWAGALSPHYMPTVSNLGVTWFHQNKANLGFQISTMGGGVQQGKYAMFLPMPLTPPPGADMSYALRTEGFKLSALGGWFKGFQAKPTFTFDAGPPMVTTQLGLDWEFRGFIDADPKGGFMQVLVSDAEAAAGTDFRTFFTDNITLGAAPGLLPPAPIPLPAALPLFGAGLFGLGFLARRRQQR